MFLGSAKWSSEVQWRWIGAETAVELAVGQFAAGCETAGMRISTSKSEAMVLRRKRPDCPVQVGGESLPKVEESSILGSCSQMRGRWNKRLTVGSEQSW